MAMIKCRECGAEVSDQASACPSCGAVPHKPTALLQGLAVAGLAIFGGWYFWGGGLQQEAAKNMADAGRKVATDTAAQYDITKRNGSKTDVCIVAGMAAAAFLQIQDEAAYKRWKSIEAADCKAAGIPH